MSAQLVYNEQELLRSQTLGYAADVGIALEALGRLHRPDDRQLELLGELVHARDAASLEDLLFRGVGTGDEQLKAGTWERCDGIGLKAGLS